MLAVRRPVFVVAILLVLSAGLAGGAPESNPGVARGHAAAATPGRVIVKFRSSTDSRVRIAALSAPVDRVQALASRTGMHINTVHEVGASMHLVELDSSAGALPGEAQIAAIRADADVEFVEPDYRRSRHGVPPPNDTLYNTTVNNIVGQWYLRAPAVPAVPPVGVVAQDVALNAAVDFEHAWDKTTGNPAVVVAILDTGVRYNHPDLTARLLPGYDFVSGESTTSFLRANDGDGWDADASDPGDWIDPVTDTASIFNGCDASDSSWHGTRVAGLIGADTNNNAGIAGATWQAKILPVRVLGKCFGNDSDIIAAMRWAAGIHISGVPDNPVANWARVINLSLGSAGSCPQSYKTVLAELAARNVVVVASAGNGSGVVESPANCPGVVAVAGIRHAGTKVGYSSLGPEVAVSAPAGNCGNNLDLHPTLPCLYSLTTTVNTGLHGPDPNPAGSSYTTQANFFYNIGTSFSAPLVTSIAALMIGVHTSLTTDQVTALLKKSALPFPVSQDPTVPMCVSPGSGNSQVNADECTCTTALCGAGMANALGSVNAALGPVASVGSVSSPAAGAMVQLDGSASSAANGLGITYAWTAVTAGAAAPATPSAAQTTVVAPSSGSATYRLTVTDDNGLQDHADVTFSVPSSGGGALDPLALLVLAAGIALRRRRGSRS